jgi:hypothetical protein
MTQNLDVQSAASPRTRKDNAQMAAGHGSSTSLVGKAQPLSSSAAGFLLCRGDLNQMSYQTPNAMCSRGETSFA